MRFSLVDKIFMVGALSVMAVNTLRDVWEPMPAPAGALFTIAIFSIGITLAKMVADRHIKKMIGGD